MSTPESFSLAVGVLVAGIAGEITHTGVFFVPALAAPLALAGILVPFRGSFPNTDAALAPRRAGCCKAGSCSPHGRMRVPPWSSG